MLSAQCMTGCCWASQSGVSSKIACKCLQAASFGRLDKGKLGIWEALQLVDSSHRQRAGHAHLVDDQRVSAVEHAMQTAELCRQASPHQDWFHLVGLIHGLGRLMALPRYTMPCNAACNGMMLPEACSGHFASALKATFCHIGYCDDFVSL